jgi:hypothetical protein
VITTPLSFELKACDCCYLNKPSKVPLAILSLLLREGCEASTSREQQGLAVRSSSPTLASDSTRHGGDATISSVGEEPFSEEEEEGTVGVTAAMTL